MLNVTNSYQDLKIIKYKSNINFYQYKELSIEDKIGKAIPNF